MESIRDFVLDHLITCLLRSERAERGAGLFVVFAIFASACVAGIESVSRLINPQSPTDLIALAAAGLIGFGGTGSRRSSAPAPAKHSTARRRSQTGNHARADSYVSLAVVASAIVVALGFPIADPLIGLAITAVIIRITWDSWWTVRGGHHGHSH